MTLPEVVKLAKPGQRFARPDNRRLRLDDGEGAKGKKKAVRLLLDEFDSAAIMFNDDITADDWEFCP